LRAPGYPCGWRGDCARLVGDGPLWPGSTHSLQSSVSPTPSAFLAWFSHAEDRELVSPAHICTQLALGLGRLSANAEAQA
jgi:hypothetical protein